jgi:hypothetical protein
LRLFISRQNAGLLDSSGREGSCREWPGPTKNEPIRMATSVGVGVLGPTSQLILVTPDCSRRGIKKLSLADGMTRPGAPSRIASGIQLAVAQNNRF